MRPINDQAGTAFLEAVAAIPVLAAVLGGVVALNAMYSAKLEAKSRGRRLAWLQADSGDCPPQTCMNDDCRAVEADLESSSAARLDSVRVGKLSLGSFFGDLRDFFIGGVTHGEGAAAARLPNLLLFDRTRQRGTTVLVCNTTARGAGSGVSVLAHACATGLDTTEYAREVCE